MRRWLFAVFLTLMMSGFAFAQGAPSVRFLSPQDGATVSGDLLVVQAQVDNFQLNPLEIGMQPKPGQGHWHLYVDGQLAGLSADGVLSVPNDAFPLLSAGQHVLKVSLHNNDHTPVPGSQSQEITVNVAQDMHYAPPPGGPAIRIVSPSNGSQVSTHLVVRVAIAGFQMDPVDIGMQPKPGHGHWHLYVDGQLAGLSASNVADVALTPGQHTLRVSLHNNDHAPVKDAQADQVTVTAVASLPKTGTPWLYGWAGLALLAAGLALVRRPLWQRW